MKRFSNTPRAQTPEVPEVPGIDVERLPDDEGEEAR
jgi:hypothetical protein